ncbi:hypothetical protein OLZ31_26465, partial [Enterobacter asburiae]|nr:hypothetical protein [Enterobacter asburiae]
MKSKVYFNGYVSFDSVKRELSKAKSEADFYKDLLANSNSQSNISQEYFDSLKSKALQLGKDISDLEAILATEPPPPELPPKKELIKICGVVEELSVLKAFGYFHDDEYRSEETAQKNESSQIGSLLLAIVGNSTASAVIGRNQVRAKSECDFVRGKVNGLSFYGWLGKTSIKVGDYIELAAEPKNGEYIVYALSVPSLRVISMTPQCRMGRKEEARVELKIAPILLGFFFVSFCMVTLLKGGPYIDILKIGGIFLILLLIAIGYSNFAAKKNPRQTTKLAELIFLAMNLPEPQKVNLSKITKNKIKNMPRTELYENDRELPSKNA